VTMEKQEDIRGLAGEYYAILKERGLGSRKAGTLPYSKVFDAKSEGGSAEADRRLI